MEVSEAANPVIYQYIEKRKYVQDLIITAFIYIYIYIYIYCDRSKKVLFSNNGILPKLKFLKVLMFESEKLF